MTCREPSQIRKKKENSNNFRLNHKQVFRLPSSSNEENLYHQFLIPPKRKKLEGRVVSHFEIFYRLFPIAFE